MACLVLFVGQKPIARSIASLEGEEKQDFHVMILMMILMMVLMMILMMILMMRVRVMIHT